MCSVPSRRNSSSQLDKGIICQQKGELTLGLKGCLVETSSGQRLEPRPEAWPGTSLSSLSCDLPHVSFPGFHAGPLCLPGGRGGHKTAALAPEPRGLSLPPSV